MKKPVSMRIGLKFDCFVGCLLPAALTLMPLSVWSLQHAKFLNSLAVQFAFVHSVSTKDKYLNLLWYRKSTISAFQCEGLKKGVWKLHCSDLSLASLKFYIIMQKLIIVFLLKVWSSHKKRHVNTFPPY